MRAIWKGSISFGLVNIPVKLYTAAGEESIDFDYLHEKDLSKIRYAKICEREEKEVEHQEIIRGFEFQPGNYVAVTDEEIKELQPKTSQTIAILAFAKQDEIDPIYFEKPFYLEPDKSATKAYELLLKALNKAEKVGIARFVLKMKEHLCILRAAEDILILNQLRFAEDVRPYEELELPKNGSVNPEELKMAQTLIEQLTKPFEAEKYKNTYRDELEDLITKKAKGIKIKPEKAPESTDVKDLMSLLEKSIQTGA
jgi:DNA end-binding protein Ku